VPDGKEHRLYLLRHAKSSWDDPDLEDRERPLNKRGMRSAAKIERYLKDAKIKPDLVLVSPAERTRQTLEQISGAFGSRTRTQVESALYSDPSKVLPILNATPEAVGAVMVIGHNPWTQDLASSLAREGDRLDALRGDFPTAALATLAFRGTWSDLAPGSARLVDYVMPAELP
jgi:phosphohistidine phosphatase